LVGSNSHAQNISNKRKELEKQRKELQLKIQQSKKELQKAKTQENQSLKELQIISTQIVTREKIIDHVSQETFEISIEIANQRKVIESLKVDLTNLKQDYGDYIASAYKKRNVYQFFFFIFDSKNMNQAFKRLKYLNNYGNYRKQQAQFILNTQKEMIKALEAILSIKQEKVGLIQLKEGEKKELIQDKKEEGVVLNKVQQTVKGLSEKIAEQEKAAKKLSKSIDNLIAFQIDEAKKKEEKRRKEIGTGKSSSPKTANSYLSEIDLKLSDDFTANKGRLPWPVNGRVIQTFGDHPHPTLRGVNTTNNGIDIVAKDNADVKCIHKGAVKAIFLIPGLDKVILMNHGEYYTVYARLATVNVKIGQVCERNEVIGQVALNVEEGLSKMHFELWKQRVFQNPVPWLIVK
jgi:septal ring factor EnvC (AmiA/AmiB activator)